MIKRLRSLSQVGWLALFFAAAVILNTLVAAIGGLYNTDYERIYRPVALALLDGRFGQLPNDLTLRYPPGFALLLVPHFALAHLLHLAPEPLITCTQIVIAAGTVAVVFLLAERVYDRLTAIIAASGWLLYPRILWFTKHPNSEVVFMLVFYLNVLCFVLLLRQRRARWAVLVGALAGVGMLIRPIALLIGVIFALFALAHRTAAWHQRLHWAALILAMNVLCVAPWELYLHQRTGQWPLLSINGARSVYDGITWAVRFGTPATRQELPADVLALMQQATVQEARFTQDTGGLLAFIMHQARERPLTVLKLYALKAARAWYAGIGIKEDTGLLLLQIPVLLLATWGLYTSYRARRAPNFVALSSVFVLYFWGMTIAALSIARYTIPVMGLLFIPLADALAMSMRKRQGLFDKLEHVTTKNTKIMSNS